MNEKMKRLIFCHLNTYYINDLCDKISCEIKKRESQYELIDIKYSGLEGNDGDAHAYLIFRLINDDVQSQVEKLMEKIQYVGEMIDELGKEIYKLRMDKK